MANEKRLIDAIRLKEVLERYVNAPHVKMGCSYSGGMSTAINTCISFLDNQPTVDAVEVVHGRWINEGGHIKMDLRCSVCNRRASNFVGGYEDWWDLWMPKYCPNCGARIVSIG